MSDAEQTSALAWLSNDLQQAKPAHHERSGNLQMTSATKARLRSSIGHQEKIGLGRTRASHRRSTHSRAVVYRPVDQYYIRILQRRGRPSVSQWYNRIADRERTGNQDRFSKPWRAESPRERPSGRRWPAQPVHHTRGRANRLPEGRTCNCILSIDMIQS
jgi:hypothetical protein